MLRNVRNVWVDFKIDGKQENIASGPRGKNDGMHGKIYQRDCGEIEEIATIRTDVSHNDTITTTFFIKHPYSNVEILADGTIMVEVKTER